jgi:hypothetical protein
MSLEGIDNLGTESNRVPGFQITRLIGLEFILLVVDERSMHRALISDLDGLREVRLGNQAGPKGRCLPCSRNWLQALRGCET